MSKVTQFAAAPDLPKLEHEILTFWDQDQTFVRSVQERPADHAYVFYDGPPFATGLPHYGHILASTIKDVIPRYKTMQGYRVERVWGWDCHGLPIENMIEGELQLKGGKKGIEALGIGTFNQACRAAILRFDKEWEVIVRRIGRWVDFKNSYKTMDAMYMESVWWGFSELYKKGMIYQGRKVVLYCPRCATPLSNFEIAMDNSYKDVEDNSLFVKFKVVRDAHDAQLHKHAKHHAAHEDRPEYFLAWTTTPWTLPGNVALAVQAEAEYSQVELAGELLWMAKDKVAEMAKLQGITHPEVVQTVHGKDLAGLSYEPLFSYMPLEGKKAHYLTTAAFVSLEDGSGIVHTAAIFGEDDYALAKQADLPCVPTLDEEGKFLPFVTPVAGQFYKKAEQWIIDDLTKRGLVFYTAKYVHSYPFCYRCSTPLFYNAVPAWFIDVQQLKKQLVDANEAVSWYPDHLKHGRFGNGLETAPDWNISRSRYWGTPMPIWRGVDATGKALLRVINSRDELAQWAVDPTQVTQLTDLHREFLDPIEVWVDDAKTVKGQRTPEVFDCWVESASMPFAAVHYPFEQKEWFEQNYPAQFITEYIAQTRAWFYCMHVISVGLFGKPSFQNALTTGTILAEDGSKMSKSKKNYPDPTKVIEQYGVDSLRLYLMSSVVMKADNLNFSEKEVAELRKNVFVVWWNLMSFYQTFADHTMPVHEQPTQVEHVMDRWILSRLATVTLQVTTAFDQYDVVKASRTLIEFVSEISTWYLRQSRDRLRQPTDDHEKAIWQKSSHVFGFVLYTLAQLFAPLTPFFSELVHHTLRDERSSIHLTRWPTHSGSLNAQLEAEMETVRKVAEVGHAQRREGQLKVRQPLAKVVVQSPVAKPAADVLSILCQELNVKAVDWEAAATLTATLDTTLTTELSEEGAARELIRQLQQLRKASGVEVGSLVAATAPAWPPTWEKEIMVRAKLSSLSKGDVVAVLPLAK